MGRTRHIGLMGTIAAMAAVACSSVPRYREMPDAGAGDAAGDRSSDTFASMDGADARPRDTVTGTDSPADTIADTPAGGDAPMDGGGDLVGDTDGGPAVCSPSCEGYQACVNAKCTPGYVATTNL